MMAEFQEVCKQWRRMCNKHTCSRNKDAFAGFPICPIAVEHEGYPCDEDPIDWTEKSTKQLEEIVMAWAAEHPEQVYPTWAEWLVDIGVFPQKMSTIPSVAFYTIRESLSVNIPADTAQKLGIEPKEE